MSRAAQRVVGVVVLLVAGVISLPASAYFFDEEGTENWIVVGPLVGMAAIGAAVTTGLPGMAREGASTGRRALTGIWWGLLALVVSLAVFWFLLNGVRGA